ncbi:MAG: cytochrome-c oxidase, cbb3-type subunit III [Comamonas sp.]|nr:cytochrome-c oxidase, cbb3-type subunit III [Comamonas sp.]
MSDFINSFWPIYISVISAAGVFGCLLLLILTARKKVESAEDNTTGHVWDGDLRELNNPMPRWWMWLFVSTVVFATFYLIAYPGMGSYSGQLGWSQVGAYEKEVERAEAELAPLYASYNSMSAEEMSKDSAAMAIGANLFQNNCAQCHSSDARGGKSFPNLTDNDWLWGGNPEQIHATITNGRMGVMPPQAEAIGTPDDVRNLANYVLSLSGSPHDSAKASMGKDKFLVCSACHGPDGKGNQALGAPNLTDDIWLHGWGESLVIDMINNGKTNIMPPQAKENGGKLTPEQVNVLTAYVWSLSNKPNSAN